MAGFKGTSVVACGTLRREITRLADEGVLDADRILFTAPGLHEWPDRLEQQLGRQLLKAQRGSRRVLVAYGDRCFLDTVDATRDTDALLREHGPEFRRVRAKNCVDILASDDERQNMARGEKVYWLTPGWIEHWTFIFKDWDPAMANETFPAFDRAIVLDGLGYFDELAEKTPERVLEIADWMKIPLEAQPVTLERLARLLSEQLD